MKNLLGLVAMLFLACEQTASVHPGVAQEQREPPAVAAPATPPAPTQPAPVPVHPAEPPQPAEAKPEAEKDMAAMRGHPCQCGKECHCGHCSGAVPGCHCHVKRADGKE